MVTKPQNKAWRSWEQVALYLYTFSIKSSACHDHERRKSSEFLIFSFRIHDGYHTKRNLPKFWQYFCATKSVIPKGEAVTWDKNTRYCKTTQRVS